MIPVRQIENNDFDWIRQLLHENWGSNFVITRGRVHNALTLPGFVAVQDKKLMGLITYFIEKDECEIVSLNSLSERIGVGTALINAVKDAAEAKNCKRLWLITTNDNTPAIRFYQKRGFQISAIHLNALEYSRILKPEIPLIGIDGIPIRDEIEMEIRLKRRKP